MNESNTPETSPSEAQKSSAIDAHAALVTHRESSPTDDLAMQSALFAILFTCSKGNESDAFKNAYFQFEYMMSGGVQRLSHDAALQLAHSLDSNELVLSKCKKCATAIVSKTAGISTIDCCAL